MNVLMMNSSRASPTPSLGICDSRSASRRKNCRRKLGACQQGDEADADLNDQYELYFRPDDSVGVTTLNFERLDSLTFEGYFTPSKNTTGRLIGGDYRGVFIE